MSDDLPTVDGQPAPGARPMPRRAVGTSLRVTELRALVRDLTARVTELEARAAREDERLAAIRAGNLRAIQREHDIVARHGVRPCTCDPKEGCNAP